VQDDVLDDDHPTDNSSEPPAPAADEAQSSSLTDGSPNTDDTEEVSP
jgi:hypothetical protein